MESAQIRPQRIGQHVGISPVILGAGDRVSIAEAVELLGIDRVDMQAPLDESFDQSPSRPFDGYGDRGRITAGHLNEPLDHRRDLLGLVIEAALLYQPTLSIQHADLM